MTGLVKFVGGFAIVAAMAMSAMPLVARADDKDVIDYRENIMKSLDAQTAMLGMMASTQVEPVDLISTTRSLALIAKQAQHSFDAKVLGGEAKPEIWANYADFKQKMDDFVVKTAEMEQDAKTGGLPVVMEKMVDVLTCKGCHDAYRAKK